MSALQIILGLCYLAVLAYTAKHVDVGRFTKQRDVQHIIFGTAASLFFLWLFRTGIYEGLIVHFLWITAAVLVLGLRWSILASALALLGLCAVGIEDWRNFGVSGLLGMVAPILISYAIYSLSFHRLPRNFFVYIFICGFFAGIVALVTKMGLLGLYYFYDYGYEWYVVADNYLILIPLLAFPEGLLNGMTMTLLVIYKPSWVYTFHDKFYLQDK